MKKIISVLLVLVMCLSMVACGAKAPEAAPAKPLKVALCTPGPINDGAWSSIAYDAVMGAKEKYGIEVVYSENVQLTDMEAVFTDYAAQGYELLIGHSYMFGDAALAVGEKYPDVKFVIIDGTVGSENVASYSLGMQDAHYIQGAIAAMLTETNKVGMVAGLEGPSIIKCVEAYKLGVASVNPDIEVMTAFTGSSDDIDKAKEAAMAMLDDGADIVSGGANQANAGTFKACDSKGALSFGETTQRELSESVILCNTSDIGGLLETAIKNVIDGTYEGGIHDIGMKDGVVYFSDFDAFSEEYPEEVVKAASDLIEQIQKGELVVPKIETLTQN